MYYTYVLYIGYEKQTLSLSQLLTKFRRYKKERKGFCLLINRYIYIILHSQQGNEVES